MHLVEQRLNSFTYRFRRPSWREEARIAVDPGQDIRDAILAHALHDVSGLTIPSLDDAWQVIRRIPQTLRSRLFIVYRGNLPEDRYYTSKGLYEAPDHRVFNKRLLDEGDAAEDPAEQAMVQRFGAAEAQEARELERTLAAKAVAARREQGR